MMDEARQRELTMELVWAMLGALNPARAVACYLRLESRGGAAVPSASTTTGRSVL